MTQIPDPEKVIIAALGFHLPELSSGGKLRVYPQPPKDWGRQDFLVVRATPGGSSTHPHLWATCYFEIEAFANSRGHASHLARRAGTAVAQACRENFRYEGEDGTAGYMFRFREVNAPAQVYDGLSSKHPDTYMFQGTYQVSVRALR